MKTDVILKLETNTWEQFSLEYKGDIEQFFESCMFGWLLENLENIGDLIAVPSHIGKKLLELVEQQSKAQQS